MKKRKMMVFALVFILLLSLSGCSASDYSAAVELMDAGQYAEAGEVFAALGSYKDSAERLTECDYRLAIASYQAGEYRDAVDAFTTLGDYQESKNYLSDATGAYVGEMLVGKWSSAELDFSGIMSESIKAGMGGNEDAEVLLQYMDLSFYSGKLVLEFTEKNTVILYQDEDLAVKNLERLIEEIGNAYSCYLLDIFKEAYSQQGMSFESAKEEMGVESDEELVKVFTEEVFGMELSEFISKVFPTENLREALAIRQSGVYSVSDTDVTINVGDETEIYAYHLEDDTLSGSDSELQIDNILFTRLS